MMRPAEMTWSIPKHMGDLPSKRSGHSLTIINDVCYLFGGTDFRRPIGPNNEIFKLDISSNEVYWTKIEVSGKCPEPRSHHSACVLNGTKILIFGGFRNSNIRYNDVWIFDTVSEEWSQPQAGITEVGPNGEVTFKRNWNNVPSPRGSHSSTIINNQMFIFGGYGGSGYARSDFNDVIALDLETFDWHNIEYNGDAPAPRSGHQGVSVRDKLYVIGGWNSMQQFADVHIFDTILNEWSKPEVEGDFGPPRWNFSAVSVFAVPHWKIFIFGGNSGDLVDGPSSTGQYLNEMIVFETETNSFSRPTVLGNLPSERADSPIVYDSKQSRIILYGGWANNWFGDLFMCKVGDVVGPPYSITSITPSIGPITGSSDSTINGLGFRSGGNTASIRFATVKGYIDVSGSVESDTEIRFETPNYEKYGPSIAECRVSVGSKSFTNSAVHFSFFAVTSADTSLFFGPAATNGCLANYPISVVIQARDASNVNRVCGMDEFSVTISKVSRNEKKDCDIIEKVDVPITILDQNNGTYLVVFEYPEEGHYEVDISFAGTFKGKAGPIRGSPFRVKVLPSNEGDQVFNELAGPLVMENIRKIIREVKDYSANSLKNIKKTVHKDDMQGLVKVKEMLNEIDSKKEIIELSIDSAAAMLQYFKTSGGQNDKLIEQVSGLKSGWSEVIRQIPLTSNSIAPLTKIWAANVSEQMDLYCKEMVTKLREFKNRNFWKDSVTIAEAKSAMQEADKFLAKETAILTTHSQTCKIFEFPLHVKVAHESMEEMKSDLNEMKLFWDVCAKMQDYIEKCNDIQWNQMNTDDLEEGAKLQVKNIKNLHKSIKWCAAYKEADKRSKFFLNTIPLISLLGAKCIQVRHWEALKIVTKRDFVPPYENPDMKLRSILELKLHEFSNDIEEISDQAVKEMKIENTLQQLQERWSVITWLMETYKDTDVPLLKLSEEDFESLEADQLTVQGMLASRFVKQFEQSAQDWQKRLANVADVFIIIGEIQRTWSYLEPLFIGSEEVKNELPEDAKRFEGIDSNVKQELKTSWSIKYINEACNQVGLLKRLEEIQQQLDICKKSLSDFLDGRRRQFPRYYFTSESDLLDILSNGSTPEKILRHTAKIFLSCDTFILDKNERTDQNRPFAISWKAGVGKENVIFEPKVPLNGKVEIYQQTILDAMKLTLFKNLQRSLVRYRSMPRSDWLMHRKPDPNPSEDSSDPAQIILLTLAINYVEEVEQAFRDMKASNPNALLDYKEKQVDQLNALIRLTQNNLNKSDRTRVMVCITMDAHSRDIVLGMIRDKVSDVSSFQWQSQLKHKYRKPPPTASFVNRDTHLRGANGERAEVAICDAILPYDYEYLGNGPRLVITPLTDRIYVTATQALNLKMGCAPAGPAGTGKTESTKDLANALAKCCYVFNCSPEMDYLGLGNIFKGLASSGSWGCFDEFNRLVPEVLSVCSVQFKSVCDGVKAETSRIVIEGDEVSLDPTCGAFITMNPGYLGRSELPEGLKALFRPITVMVPDLVLICENMLMAEGFTQAKVLASKFYGLYSLLAALLSKALHYDWGLRAVKSVLVVAGGFKRQEPDLPEEALLMRALRDFNIPKIVREDEVVFFGLLGDLFPGIDPPRKVNASLESFVESACTKMGNHPDDLFRLKVVQLEELLEIRHCVFVMGPPGAGKSTCWKTLAEARTLRGDKTKYVDINPKSVKTEELYGYISMATREWKDGLLSKVMRDLGEIPDEKPKWIILDGDLDANWIESMNSVMDDNKMLTLASNERIPLKSHMRLIFEIRDLRFATPATVSRAGILYISTDDGTQWNSLIQSWLKKVNTTPENVEKLRQYFNTYVRPTLKWMIKHVSPIVSLQDMNFVQTLLYMLDGILTPQILSAEAPVDAIEKSFVFAMIWSMGSALTVSDDGTDNRKLFSDWWRGECKKVRLPTQYTVFDYWYDANTNTFELWSKSPFLANEIEYDTSIPMSSITVPTPETCSVTYWMKILVSMRHAVMLAGPSGTGKTQIIRGMLDGNNSEDLMSTTINFNYYTTSATLMTTMGLPLVKKTGTNYGPPGQAKLIYFIDDINLPEVDKYDTQSAIALLRQHIEYEHVYDLSKLNVKSIGNTQFVACMNPTAGSFEINPRLQRWFATFAIGLPDTISLHKIYSTFLLGHLKKFDSDIQSLGKDLVKVAVNLHREIILNFRKTAQNFHYEFNIRHISNVFQGLLVSRPEQFKVPEKFIYMWVHESERVYGDRLVNYEDLAKYKTIVQSQHKKVFPSYNISRFYSPENADPLIFCHFADNIQEKNYDMVSSITKLSQVLEDALHEYNELNANMDLVLFEDAMKHVARIVRIIMNSGGHALLVGVGGSGKQSLSRLAAFICGYTVKQIVISSTYGVNDLKEDLKAMYNKAGIKEEGVMFLLTDSQITNERFLVYINDLLASGNIPDLFGSDEIDAIVNAVTNKVKGLGKIPDRNNCWEYFINQIKQNLHVVLAFSPVGDAFRTRARRFPAIVNCTVIDWFQPWPKEALFSVGKKFLADVELGSPEIRSAIELFLPFSFTEVNKMAEKFRQVERRYVYTTPKSYLELLKLFSTLLGQKVGECDSAIERLSNGLTKLRETSDAVTQIEAELKVSLEEADNKRSVAEGIAAVVSKEKEIVEVETQKAQVKAKEVASIQEEVLEKQRSTEEDLAKAEPMVEAAMV